MAIKDVLAIVATAEADAAALRAAALIAERNDAKFMCLAIGVLATSTFAYGETVAAGVYAEMIAEERTRMRQDWSRLEAEARRLNAGVETRPQEVAPGGVARAAALHARAVDLAVATAPQDGATALRDDVIEGALLGGAAPLLVVPPKWTGDGIGRRAVLAWDASREAARAARASLDLMAPQGQVVVATVDARIGLDAHGETPGHDVAAHLARHGLQAEVRNLDGMGRSIADSLLDTARAFGADLLVMGGYRHARIQQTLFGGVTRALLRHSEVPMLLAH